jgi:hypothetical protein
MSVSCDYYTTIRIVSSLFGGVEAETSITAGYFPGLPILSPPAVLNHVSRHPPLWGKLLPILALYDIIGRLDSRVSISSSTPSRIRWAPLDTAPPKEPRWENCGGISSFGSRMRKAADFSAELLFELYRG